MSETATMPVHEGRRPGWGALLVLLGYLCLVLVYLVWVWSDEISDQIGDSAMYMLIARSLSPFYPHSEVLAQAVQSTTYPPLFPFVIGLAGGGMLAAHLVTAFALLAAIGCFYRWMRDEGLSQAVSAWAAAVFALMPGTYFLTLNIWTENPYLLLSLITILAVNRADDPAQPRPGLLWTAALAVGGATLTRAAALPLLAAFIIHLGLRRPRHWPGLVLASALPFAAWVAWSKLHQAGISGYVGQWSSVYGEHPAAALAAQVQTEFRYLWIGWIQAWLGTGGSIAILVHLILAFGCVCLFACARRLWQRRFDGLYAALYIPLLLVWPFPAEAIRLSYVLVPVLLAGTFSMVHALALRHGTLARMVPISILGALTLAVLPALVLTLHRFLEPLPQDLSASRRTQLYYSDDPQQSGLAIQTYAAMLKLLKQVDQLVPEGQCLFSTKAALVTLYSNRMSYLPPYSSVSDEAFDQAMGRCRYAFLLGYSSPGFNQALYPLNRLGDRAQPVSVLSSDAGGSITIYAALAEIGGH